MIIDNYSDIYKEDLKLRPYQQKAKKEIFESWDEVDNVMFQMPTGTGKTRLFTSIIRDINDYSIKRKEPVKILIIAHRTELIDQIHENLRRYQVPHNLIAGGRERNYKYPVSVASIQTITHPNNLKDAKKLNVQFVIIDEAHHALATTYKKLWDLYSGSKKLGVTATPWRMNHKGFLGLFNKLVLSMPIKDFIKQGYLAPYKYFSLRSDSNIQSTIDDIELDKFGEYKESSMEEKMDIGSIRAQLLESYLALAEGKKGIIYAINIVHAKHICAEYKKAGYEAVSIDSKTPAAERKDLVEKFRKGEIDIIVNVDIFSEGFDCPDIEFIQLARPTRSLVKYLQQVGRGLRPTENKVECIILDNVGMYSRFGLPNARRHWKQHFLGKDVTEEPVKVGAKGTGKSRYVDLSEGTEDMELIQDVYDEVEVIDKQPDSSDASPAAFNDFFPLFGITLGKTTWKQAKELGYKVEKWENGPARHTTVENVAFWDHEGEGIFTSMYWVRDESDFPRLWKTKGFSWYHSYNKWWDVFKKLGYKLTVTKQPEHNKYSRHLTLNAEFEALSPDGSLLFDLYFDYGKDGYQTTSPNTLYSITVEYNQIENPKEEEVEEEEEFDPIQLLVDNHFVCDNFIFYFTQSKRIFESYIQDDKYFIISELVIDEKEQCVHRNRVGKIPGDSWMFWQMLREKVDNLKSIIHYGANYTVFHYEVMSKDNVEKDKFFDYKGREIDSPEIVKSKYEEEISHGQINDYIDVPVSKASFKTALEGGNYVVYRTIKGQTKQIARMSINSAFSKEYPLSVYQVRIGGVLINPQTTKRYNDVHTRIVRSDDNSLSVRKIENGKAYLLKYNLDGKLLQKGTIVSDTPEEVSPLNPLKGEDFDKLKHAFDKKSTSYKYFWLMSLLQIYKDTQVDKIPFRQILIKMVAKAWKYVFMLNGQFSQSDQLPILLSKLQRCSSLQGNSSESEVENELNNIFEDLNIKSILNPLLKNVPYRFLSPWIPFTSNEDVMKESRNPDSRCPYELYNDYVVISRLWRETFIDLYESIQLLAEYGLDAYLKIHQDVKEVRDFYNTRFTSLSQLLRGIKRRKSQKEVNNFLEKYNFPINGNIEIQEILNRIPESGCMIDNDGRKIVSVPGEMWSLKLLDKLLSNINLNDTFDNVSLLSEYGLEAYKKLEQNENTSEDIYNTKYISLNKLLKGIKNNKNEKVVKSFLEKYDFPLSGKITPAELMAKIPESQCRIDSEGHKRVNVPGGMWSLKLIDKLLSE